MTICTMLDLSTGHLDPSSKEWLTIMAEDSSVMEGEHGWFTPVYDPPCPEEGRPPALEVIFIYARSIGCSFVLFDADAIEIDDLPTFED